MKNFLLIGLAIFTLNLTAQTTHVVSWQIGSDGAEASPTIEIGDTVRWEWDDTAPHTVTSLTGSTESFDSGSKTGEDETYSVTFSLEGTNPYQCDFHPGTMNGTVTVETVLGIEDNTPEGFKMISNITFDILTLILPSDIQSGNIKMHDLTGKQILSKDYNNKEQVEMDVSSLNDAVYIITIESNELEFAKRFIKQ